jgi:hypothetical protein
MTTKPAHPRPQYDHTPDIGQNAPDELPGLTDIERRHLRDLLPYVVHGRSNNGEHHLPSLDSPLDRDPTVLNVGQVETVCHSTHANSGWRARPIDVYPPGHRTWCDKCAWWWWWRTAPVRMKAVYAVAGGQR